MRLHSLNIVAMFVLHSIITITIKMNKKYSLLLFALALLCSNLNLCAQSTRLEKMQQILDEIKAPEIPVYSAKITRYGAKPDGKTDAKPVFDKLIKMSTRKGGIRIIVPPGDFFVDGPLHLESNVCLDIQEGARIIFGSNAQKYLPVVFTSWEGTFLYNYSPFIYAYEKENVSIIGKGTIDGSSSETFATWRKDQKESQMLSREMNHNNTPLEKRQFGAGHLLRPHMIQFFRCKNILVEDVTITDSPFWCIHLLQSENATFRAINFIARNANNDGIDPEYSRNVLIENINFDNSDDNVAIKAGRDYEGRRIATPSENIIIRNCRFKGLHGVVIGSEMSAGVRNVFVDNCSYGGYVKRGIYLKSNPDRGGYIKDVYVNNVEFGHVEDCFYVTSFYQGQGSGFATDIQNVYVENMKCKKADAGGIIIQGFSELPVRNFSFTDVIIDSAGVAMSLTNAEKIEFKNVSIGGVVDQAPSAVGHDSK